MITIDLFNGPVVGLIAREPLLTSRRRWFRAVGIVNCDSGFPGEVALILQSLFFWLIALWFPLVLEGLVAASALKLTQVVLKLVIYVDFCIIICTNVYSRYIKMF